MTATVTADQLAGLLATPAIPPREAFATKPSRALVCTACKEPLDHTLAAYGHHILCVPTPPVPTTPTPQPSLFAAPAAHTAAATTHPIKTELIHIIRWAAANAPRSLQTAVGPSELGVDCMRRLAYRLTGTPTVNTTTDPWFSIVGTAVHDWLAVALDRYQAEADITGKRPYANRRFIVEERVTVTSDEYGVSGSCDLFDVDLATVVDHKVVGADALKKYIQKGPSNQYRKQVHIYGAGHAAAGRVVREVALAFYPRSGYLDGMHVWSEPYNPQIAADALTRANSIKQLAAALPPNLLPATPDPVGCTWCPFFRPGGPADATGCPGATA